MSAHTRVIVAVLAVFELDGKSGGTACEAGEAQLLRRLLALQ